MATSDIAKPNPTRTDPGARQAHSKSVVVLCVAFLVSLLNPVASALATPARVTSVQSNVTSSLQGQRPLRPISPVKRHRRFLSFDHQPMVDHNPLPMLFIGEVRLDDYPQCQAWLDSYLNHCQRQYELFLHSQISRRYQKYQQAVQKRAQTALNEGKPVKSAKPFSYERNAEYIKHASCCGMWQARRCVVSSIERNLGDPKDRQCPANLVDRYRLLPSDPTVRADVLDYCSEYGDGSLICHHSGANSAAPSQLRSPFATLAVTFALLVALPLLVPRA